MLKRIKEFWSKEQSAAAKIEQFIPDVQTGTTTKIKWKLDPDSNWRFDAEIQQGRLVQFSTNARLGYGDSLYTSDLDYLKKLHEVLTAVFQILEQLKDPITHNQPKEKP